MDAPQLTPQVTPEKQKITPERGRHVSMLNVTPVKLDLSKVDYPDIESSASSRLLSAKSDYPIAFQQLKTKEFGDDYWTRTSENQRAVALGRWKTQRTTSYAQQLELKHPGFIEYAKDQEDEISLSDLSHQELDKLAFDWDVVDREPEGSVVFTPSDISSDRAVMFLDPRSEALPQLPQKIGAHGQVIEPSHSSQRTDLSLTTSLSDPTSSFPTPSLKPGTSVTETSESGTIDTRDTSLYSTTYTPSVRGARKVRVSQSATMTDPTASRRSSFGWSAHLWKKPQVVPVRKIQRFIRRRDPQRDWEAHWRMATGWGSRVWGRMGELTGEIPVRARRKRRRYITPLDEVPLF